MASPKAETFRPQRFGKFFLLQKLGAGGMAEIYRGKTAGTSGFEKELVVKRILPALSSDKQFVRMLVNEAKLTVALTHPTIAQVYELGEVEEQYFISMEFVEGASLHDLMHMARLAKRPLTIEQSIYLCLEVLRGLDYAHRRTDGAGNALGIVHCDVSPDNVMVTWDGGVKLLDFGVARAAQSSLSNYREGTLMGKLSYAAPEQAEGEWFDHRVDLFAVGVMFYELITGEHPFGRVQDIPALRASRRKAVVPPSQLRGDLPAILDSFVLRSLARGRDERFQNAKEMSDELVDLLFPTPSIAVQEHIAVTMQELYKERIERLQKQRAHDPLHMKAMANVRAPDVAPAQVASAPGGQPKADATRIFVSALADPVAEPLAVLTPGGVKERSLPRKAKGRPKAVFRRRRVGPIVALSALLGLGAGAAGTHLLDRGAPPVLVVLSEPAGAEVLLGDRPLGKTPLVLDSVEIGEGRESVVLKLAGHRQTVVPLVREGRVARADGRLESALGTFRIDSRPSGATVRLNGKPVGVTPLTIDDVALDQSQRIDLERRGYELDSFIVKPDDVGGEVVRPLQRLP